MSDLIGFRTDKWAIRAAIVAAVLAALWVGWFSISERLGGMLAVLTPASSEGASDIADFALTLAPGDPEVNGLAASTRADAETTAAIYERTVRLAPRDQRWRVALGRAYEQAGKIDAAEAEFKEAVSLAPNYGFPRWHLGNFYLRQDREAEAFAELKRASEDHHSFRDQVFSLAWDYFGRDAAQVERNSAENPETWAFLARFFAARGAGENAVSVWNRLSEADKEKYRDIGKWTVRDLMARNSFAEALEISRQLGETKASPGAVTNPSFESPIDVSGDLPSFGWELKPGEPRVEAAVDSRVKRTGDRSFRIAFKGYSKPSFADLFQMVVVEPNRDYVLRFHVRTEGLSGEGGPLMQVANVIDNATLAASDAYLPDRGEWTEVAVRFSTPANCRAISIRTVRGFCGESCMLTGSLWYDDFALTAAN